MALNLPWTRNMHFEVWHAKAGDLRCEVAREDFAGGWAGEISGIAIEGGFDSRGLAQQWAEDRLRALAHGVLGALGETH